MLLRSLGMMPIKPEQAKPLLVGYTIGVTYMGVISFVLDRKRNRMHRRTEAFCTRLVEDAWVYLPLEVKAKIQDEIGFYNIALTEDL